MTERKLHLENIGDRNFDSSRMYRLFPISYLIFVKFNVVL